ncbi:MAG: sulfotransferase [Gemmatimonadota bacterium]
MTGTRAVEASRGDSAGAARDAPILVTGSHRSGTTWAASMLALAPGTVLVDEPFHVRLPRRELTRPRDRVLGARQYGLGGLARHWFTWAPALPPGPARRAFERVLEGRTRRVFRRRDPRHWLPWRRRGRLIIKDPLACLSSEWIADGFGVRVLVLVRHPAAFAASLKRLGWSFGFEDFRAQPALLEAHLAPYRADIESPPSDIVDQAGLVWTCLYAVLSAYLERHPEWLVRTHEALSLDPMAEFRGLYDALGLAWTPDVARGIAEHTGAGNPVAAPEGVVHELRRDSRANVRRWKEVLGPDEVERLRRRTAPVADRFYGPEDWA